MIGAEAIKLAEHSLEQHGGVKGFVAKFEQSGLSGMAKPWVGTGPNQAATPAQIKQALGADAMARMAKLSSMQIEDIAKHLAQHLRAIIDKITPGGKLPS